MICEYTVKRFCSGDLALIENYDKAIADDSQTWHCHHRMEIQPDGTRLSKKWMVEHNIYYDLDPCMLIFLTDSEHKKIHTTGRKITEKMREAFRKIGKDTKHDNFKGKHHTAESRAKTSAKLKGRKLVMVNGRRTYVFPEVKNA